MSIPIITTYEHSGRGTVYVTWHARCRQVSLTAEVTEELLADSVATAVLDRMQRDKLMREISESEADDDQ